MACHILATQTKMFIADYFIAFYAFENQGFILVILAWNTSFCSNWVWE